MVLGILKRYLKIAPTVANNGLEGIEAVKAVHFDVCLMDMCESSDTTAAVLTAIAILRTFASRSHSTPAHATSSGRDSFLRQMPLCGGVEAARRIRQWEASIGRPAASRLRIIALTANASEEDKNDCLSAGMDAFLRCVRVVRWI